MSALRVKRTSSKIADMSANDPKRTWASPISLAPICYGRGRRAPSEALGHMKRREFITLLGGAAAGWPLLAGAQQPVVPVVGFLDSRSPDALTDRLRGFRQGLKETGYVEGENVIV